MTSAQSPYGLCHLPSECYPPAPESGAAPEDDDMSEETEDNPDVIEDSDASGDEAHEDVALLTSKRRRRVDEDLIEITKSSPSGCNDDDDANLSPPDAPSREASAPPAPKRSSGFFADEDDLISDEDTDAPPLKKTKISSDKPDSTKESMPLSPEDEPAVPLLPRKVVAKVKASSVAPSASASIPPSSNNHPIHAAVDIVVDFVDQFVRMEQRTLNSAKLPSLRLINCRKQTDWQPKLRKRMRA